MTIERLNIMTIIALLATVMLLAGCSVLDDDKIRLRNGMPIWSYSYSYTINGQYVRYDDWDVIKHTDSFLLWNVERFYKFIPSLDGQTLYLYLSSNSSPHRVVLNFWSEDGPLKEGVNYD